MKFNNDLLHRDIIRRLDSVKKPKSHLAKIGISRRTFYNISENKGITISTFLKLVEWLEFEPQRYFERTKRTYTKINRN